jgi:hypothetical protein
VAVKLTSRQQAQLAFLEPYARQLSAMGSLIEQMAAPKADEQLGRTLIRQVAASKTQAQGLGLTKIAESLGTIEQTARRTGGGLSKFRTLRELYAMLRLNHEQAMRAATTEEAHGEEGGAEGH